jgi:hypothetical protein
MAEPFKFLGKDITVKKTDGTFLRGCCITERADGLILNIRNEHKDKYVFVPFAVVSEVVTGGGSAA